MIHIVKCLLFLRKEQKEQKDSYLAKNAKRTKRNRKNLIIVDNTCYNYTYYILKKTLSMK
jgi:hypothetical protein